MTNKRNTRITHGVGSAFVATFFALASHALVDAMLPSIWLIAFCLCLATPVCVAIAGRGLSFSRVSGAVLSSQVLFHVSSSLSSSATIHAGSPSNSVDGSAGQSHGQHGSFEVVLSGAAPQHVSSAFEPRMVLGHLLAAIVTIGLLYRGEKLLRRLLALALAVFTRPISFNRLQLNGGHTLVKTRFLQSRDGAHDHLVLVACLVRRGPPMLLG